MVTAQFKNFHCEFGQITKDQTLMFNFFLELEFLLF